MGEPIKNITIVGGGTSGWITACYLARMLETKIRSGAASVTVIESPRIGIIGVGESTARPMADMLRMIGVNETEFFKRTDATFKLSGLLVNWNVGAEGKPKTWVNPFYTQSDVFGVNPGYVFAKHAMREGGGPLEESFSETMSVCPAIIRAHKGPRLAGDGDFQARVPYSYHMNAVHLAKILTERGKALGVSQILDEVKQVVIDERGFVSALELEERGTHPIEFVIDATGFASIIIGKAMGEPFESYGKYLLNDRAAVAELPHDDPERIEPATRATAMNAGWTFRVPLFNRIGSGYIYSSQFVSDDEAIAEFIEKSGPTAKSAVPRIIRMRIGKTRRSWVKNCVAVGLSSGFVEPLEATAIFSVQVALRWLRNYFPDTEFNPAVIDRYNLAVDTLYEEIVEYIALNYYMSNRDDTPYWRAVRAETELPPGLKENLDLWRHTMPDEFDLRNALFFTPTAYRAALFGKGFYKGRNYMQAASVSEAHWGEYKKSHCRRIDRLLDELPDHYALLRHMRGETGE